MRSSRPPIAATWLLEHLRSGRGTEPITGDLIEEYQHGRSGAWYWRQVLAAISVSFWKEIGARPLIAIRALITGWAIWFLYEMWLARLVLGRWFLPIPVISDRVSEFLYYPLFNLLARAFFLLSGQWPPRLVFRDGDAHGLGWLTISLSIWVGSGWIIARTHRAQAIETVLLFSLSVLSWELCRLPWAYQLMLDTRESSRYFGPFILELLSTLLPPMGIVLGGLLAGEPGSDSSAHKVGIAT